MKKIILSLCFLIAATTFVSAQAQNAEAMAQRQAQQKQTLKDSLGLSDEQVQIVLDVQVEFRPKMMELRDVAEADRPAKMKEINDAMQKRLGIALKDEALAKKVSEFNARRRGGGGRGPRQGQ